MGTTLAVLIGVGLTAALLLWPRLRRADGWKATVTPLASIIGSGFLVLGPVLDDNFGVWAPLVMATLCLVAYGFGAAIRFNIARIDTDPPRHARTEQVETLAAWALALAYVISVAYYLNLFGAFATSLWPDAPDSAARWVTTLIYGVILAAALFGGFRALEGMEQTSVGIKLAIIAGLLAGLALHFGQQASTGNLVINPAVATGWGAVTLAFGLIVTVQGFETSRYLGNTYSAEMRIRSMRWAQWLSAGIYMAYISLLVFLFPAGKVPLSETAIIDMMGLVAPVLPPLLIAAALSAQFSAAVADTGGAGGLVQELTSGRVRPLQGYTLLIGAGLVLTWAADVFQIIAIASRAFAVYYGLQAGIAALSALNQRQVALAAGFGLLAGLGFVIAIFGQAVEG
ncbi:hypothetical protein EU803_17795 [Loktanella sp. IMCC34160]|uniref:hypothetical protein n=1 Tax=Loktanella sp. IMCC34160 TaxID=2510646 RepID=UPI00101B5CFA|nr:hypothetical protein [Loktanella sp. IMCC34160]RYG89327.1 hypothetical protein EU803_17795 [Loktanella sp. IMCC34160]